MALILVIGDSREVNLFKKYKKRYLISSDHYGPIG